MMIDEPTIENLFVQFFSCENLANAERGLWISVDVSEYNFVMFILWHDKICQQRNLIALTMLILKLWNIWQRILKNTIYWYLWTCSSDPWWPLSLVCPPNLFPHLLLQHLGGGGHHEEGAERDEPAEMENTWNIAQMNI